MNNLEVSRLYKQISNDLSITKLSFETEETFHDRLVYSAIGFWILNIFKDRYTSDDVSVSKMHVTLSACDVLNSYIKIDSNLSNYFTDINRFVSTAENTYLNLGYVNSGKYTFKNMTSKQRVRLSNNQSLLIRDYAYKNQIVGFGIIKPKQDADILIDDFFSIKLDAKQYFINLIKNLKFDYYENKQGKYEIYNVKKNRWEFYSDKLVTENEYAISKVDDGLAYAIFKKTSDGLFIAYLPDIYSKSNIDSNYYNEIWRVILGCCAYNDSFAKVLVKKYSDAYVYTFKGYILPENEMSFIRAISWPVGCACYDGNHSPKGYLVLKEFTQVFEDVLNRFNLVFEEVR